MTFDHLRTPLISVGRSPQTAWLRVPELAQTLDISEGTVRNDLNALEDEGRLKRVRGGAVLQAQDQF